ncbi:hypothetical protein WMY93_001540 [Mugilogobius chulae]|uniref:Vitellogenin domain-containing protein n=1 Tax=Mugilogobius chulae TaxID=88201 RepID=A0AAW0Q5Q6_9GOBI
MFLLFCNTFTFALFLLQLQVAVSVGAETRLCDSTCSDVSFSGLSSQIGLRYTYRYSATITTSLYGSSAGRSGLALNCLIDLDVISKCHLMMQIRNPQIKRLSSQKDHSVQNLKSLRESLERARLKFSLRGGRVTALCLQEGEQVWVRNIKRAILSMLQTSASAARFNVQNETDLHGTCRSRYERRGSIVLKSRDLSQCQQSRLANLWPHSVAVSDETALRAEQQCVQRHGPTMMEEVNCTESVAMTMLSQNPGQVKIQTESSLSLLRTQPEVTETTSGFWVLSDLHDPQLISQTLHELVFQLRDLPLSQLKLLWQETSFKCQNIWQLLLDALSACGSENCVLLLTELIRSKELEQEHAMSLLATLPLIPHPTPQMIVSVNDLLEMAEFRPKAMLVGSSLVYQLCQTLRSPCTELPSVRSFLQALEDALKSGCENVQIIQVKELLYSLKSVGNAGVFEGFIPLLNRCALSESAPIELRLAAVHAFRRMPCSQNRSVLLQLYRASQEDPEVRIAAYQQLLLCPNRKMFTTVRDTLRNETSSQVGSYVWSHLSSVLRSEDPLKQSLTEMLPDDVISRDFEREFLKYSSYADHTLVSDLGITNLETSLIFSSKSFLPRSASVNLTVYFNGRASNLLEVDLRVENAEPFFKNLFGHETSESDNSQKPVDFKETKSSRRKTEDRKSDKETCLSGAESYLSKASALLFRRSRLKTSDTKCWISIKMFGNEVSVFSCEDIANEINQFSLSMAELAIKLLKGQEVRLDHRTVPLTEELVLPSLSGLPLKLSINMSSLLSLRLRGSAHYRDPSHFNLNGYVKPNAYVRLVARMGVDSALGQAAVEWDAALRSALSLDGSVHLQEGQDLRVMLNTPEDAMDIISFSSHVFQLSGANKEEIKGRKNHIHKTVCTPKLLSKMVGWQLCSNASYPMSGLTLPPAEPTHFSLRLLKLDRGLHYYLLEAAYSMLTQRGSWTPREASLHLLLATPQSSVPRDMSLDLAFSPHRLLLRFSHPQKTIIIQGQLEQHRNHESAKVEISIDGAQFYIMGFIDKQTIAAEQRTNYHIEAKLSASGAPMILSANVTRGLGRKTSFSASVKNLFRETASVSVSLERRRDSSGKQYSVEGELLLPGLVGGRMLGLMEQKASLWSSALRLKYGLGGEARHLHQQCFTSQRLKSERGSNHTYIMRADHEFYCSNTAAINHKVQVRHEESPSLVKSHLDLSYGKHWDELNNRHKLILSQMFKNQSTHNHTSYTLEFSLQAPEKNLNYRTQLLHSHLKHFGSESSTHLKIHYNNLMPLVAGLNWKGPPPNSLQKKWEGSLNLDTPWLYIYTSHKLSQQRPHTLQLTSELTSRKWLTIQNLVLEGLFRHQGRETEVWVHMQSPGVTYLQTGGWVLVGKKSVKASCSLKSLWTSPLGGELSLETSKFSHTLEITSSYGRHNVSVTAALNSADKKFKKRQALLKVSWCELPGRPTELLLAGEVEELKRDKKTIQKIAKLQLRQPFQVFANSLILQETFTIDNLKGLYTLESKASVSGNTEMCHTLTIGHRPPKLFLCSALIHPFSFSIVPSESEICLNLTTNQTQKHLYGRLRSGDKDKLSFFGQVNFKHLDSPLKGIRVKANFSHHLQLQLPSTAIMEGDVCWTVKNNTGFDYLAKGKLRIERQECQVYLQLNGTSSRMNIYSSLSHPFKAKIPKVLEARAAADIFTGSGGGRTSVYLRVDGKDMMTMNVQVFHSLQRAEKAVGLKMNVFQSLLPTIKDLFVDLGANLSVESVYIYGSHKQSQQTLLTHIKMFQKNISRLQTAVSGDLHHNIRNLHFLPSAVGLYGTLEKSDRLINGLLRVKVANALYRVELRHQNSDAEEKVFNIKRNMSQSIGRDWLCVWSGAQNLCVNISHRLNQQGGDVYTQFSHNFERLKVAGIASSCSAKLGWIQDHSQISGVAEIQSGVEHLKAEFKGGKESGFWDFETRLEHQLKALVKRGIAGSIQAKAHYKLESNGFYSCLTVIVKEKQIIDTTFNIASKNSTALLSVLLWQQIKLLQGVVPTTLQMNCSGDTAADRHSVQCYGAAHSAEAILPHTSYNLSLSRSGCSAFGSIFITSRDLKNGSVTVSVQCLPFFRFKASVQQSLDVLQTLGFPAHGEIILTQSQLHSPGLEVGLELGNCYVRGHLGKRLDVYTVNATSYCPALQEISLPVSLVIDVHLSGAPCRLTASSVLRADDQDFTIVLQQSCSLSHISASLTHSFRELRRKGLPQDLTVEVTAPRGPEHSGALLVKVGPCHLKVNRVKQDNDRTLWIWVVESDCPLLKAHINGSVWQDPQGIWTAFVETSKDGKRGLLRINARTWPELHLESEFSHSLPAFSHIPEHSRLTVTSQIRRKPYSVEAVIQMHDCVVRAKGEAQHGLQGELLYHTNCTLLEKWGSPLFMAIDDKDLETSLSLRNIKNKNEVTLYLNHCIPFLKKLGLPLNASVTMHSGSQDNSSFNYILQSTVGSQKLQQQMLVLKTAEGVRVQSSCRHSVDTMRTLRVPANSSIQVELRSGELKGLMLQSWFDNKHAGINIQIKCLHLVKEFKAAVWHSWSWLQDRGVPAITEGMLTIYGNFLRLQSKAQLSVDGLKVLSSGLNVSSASGRLTAILSYVLPPSNQTSQHTLEAALAAQFKGPVRSTSVDIRSHDWRMLMMGDIGGLGGTKGSKEVRVTVRHTVHSQSSPTFQMEAWGRLTESQLRCSMALNPELSSSMALILQGHQLPHRKDLMLKFVQKIPRMLMYLPSHLSVRTQLNQSQSSLSSLVEVLSGRRSLWAFGELETTETGYRQALELKHSCPKLKPLPKMVTMKTVYERRDWSYQVQHEALWGNHEVSLSGLYSSPPSLNMGNHTIKVHISSAPRWTNFDLILERFPQGRVDKLSLDWMRHGQLEQVRMLSLWSRSDEVNETKLELSSLCHPDLVVSLCPQCLKSQPKSHTATSRQCYCGMVQSTSPWTLTDCNSTTPVEGRHVSFSPHNRRHLSKAACLQLKRAIHTLRMQS